MLQKETLQAAVPKKIRHVQRNDMHSINGKYKR